MMETVPTNRVPVNYGKLLENQLKKWEGGGHHPRGIAEYISNSDDSYRRLKRFKDNLITVEIHSRTGKKIEKLIIQDYAEGMSYSDLENRFFQYFESFSGREKGEKVTGRFGTGGKAYAIMNFRHCWITSIQNGLECKAWFKWDSNNQCIIKGYNNGGYRNKGTTSTNGTIIILESSIRVSHQLKDFVIHLEKLSRIRHVLKSQNVVFKIIRNKQIEQTSLEYYEPNPTSAIKTWKFDLPASLRNEDGNDNEMILRYFEKPISDNAFIDLSDGISSVADLMISSFDDRQFSKYINGSLTISKLMDSVAVKENRKGLEEGDDLTEDIKNFIKAKIALIINEVEENQKLEDREKRINAANEKLKELSKFLSKQDLKFKLDLKELKKRFSMTEEESPTTIEAENNVDESKEKQAIYRKPFPDDPEDLIIKGKWIIKTEENSTENGTKSGTPEFLPDPTGDDTAVKVGEKVRIPAQQKKEKKGLQVMFSNDPTNTDSPTFKEYDDPVSDRDLTSKGIIWINAVHPIIVKFDNAKVNEAVRNENIANFVLMIVAQYYAQKEAELQPEDERDQLLLFRKYFFKLQMDIRNDQDIAYYDTNETNRNLN